ncbi:MAG: 7-carboxy-7-deazaguanine synthase QueE [Methylohalobius sp.]|nr:7-carboxy-7-deazaguanine synthase QueE [Methylohalobius sp.]
MDCLSLKVSEIFFSIQGESKSQGWPTVFVRLTGCPLRCRWCDTAYAFHGGKRMGLEEIVSQVQAYSVSHVTVTGGEPLAQPTCPALLRRLVDLGFIVSLETSGALDLSPVDSRVVKVMDLKPPGSGEEQRNLWENLKWLTPKDQVKFVLADRDDYEWAKRTLQAYHLPQRCEVLFSPVYQEMNPRVLAEWILEDRLPVRLQIQLHKILWGEERGR